MAVFAGGKARLAGCCGSGRGDLHSLPGDCLRQAALEIYRRLMDAVEPALVEEAEQALRATGWVLDTGQVRMRWIGHQIRAECEVIVGPGITAVQAHQVTIAAKHALLHAIPRLAAALVHADPQSDSGPDPHQVLASHRQALAPGSRPR